MRKGKRIIYHDIKAEEKYLRELFPKPKDGPKISSPNFNYEYNIKQRAIFNTYCRKKYTLYQLNYRLNTLKLKNRLSLYGVFSFIMGIFSGLLTQVFLELIQILPDFESLLKEYITEKIYSEFFYPTCILLASFGLLALVIGVAAWVQRICSRASFSDYYHLEAYEIHIIEAQLSTLENESLQKFRNLFQRTAK